MLQSQAQRKRALTGVLEFLKIKFDIGQNEIILKWKDTKATNFMSLENSMIIASALVPW